MKLILFIFLLFPLTSFASEVENIEPEVTEQEVIRDHNFNFKLNAALIFFGLGDLSLEYKITPNITVGGSLIFGGFTQSSVGNDYEFDIGAFGGNIEGTYHFNEAFKNSFYTSAVVGTFDFDVELKNSPFNVTSDFSSTYIGLHAGYTWHWKHLNFNIGAGYNHSFADDEAEIQVNSITGTTTVKVNYNLILEAAFGITF